MKGYLTMSVYFTFTLRKGYWAHKLKIPNLCAIYDVTIHLDHSTTLIDILTERCGTTGTLILHFGHTNCTIEPELRVQRTAD